MRVPSRKCQLVIDSCCDLPYEVIQTLDVRTMSYPFDMSDGQHMDDFGRSMSFEEFYGRMEKGEQPKTAQIPIQQIVDTFTEVAQSGIPTVFLILSSGLSGTYDTMEMAAQSTREQYPGCEIYVVDTLLASIAEGFLVLEAVKQRDNGLTAAELAAWAEEARYFVHGYFTVDSLEYLRRGGRIPPIAASAGAKLDIKPILTFDLSGRLTVNGLVRGRKKSIRAVAKLTNENIIEPDRAQIVFGNAVSERDMRALEDLYEAGECPFVETSIGTIIGSHVGPGMVAASFWGPDRRRDMSLGDRIARSVRGKADQDDGPSMPPFADAAK